MCDPISITMGVLGGVGLATSATMGAVQAHQQKKQAKKTREQAEKLEKQRNRKITTNDTANRAEVENNDTKRTIGSLRIPLEKTTNTSDTGINSGISGTTSTGLNIPM